MLDGVEVRFDFYPPNTFKAELPCGKNGTRIIQLTAIDEAGNVTNMCEMVILIDFDKLSFKILDKDFVEKTENENYGFKELQLNYSHKELV